MQKARMKWRLGGILVGLVSVTLQPVLAQEFPNKTVRIVSASAAGGSIDTAVRLIAAEMTKSLGQTVIVENKTGGNQTIAYTYVAKQVPNDGYVIAAVSVGSMTSLPLIMKDLQFDPLKDLPPILDIGEARLLFASPKGQSWKTVKELVGYAQANPGKLNFGTSASSLYLYMLALLRALGVKANYIPYNSSGSAYMVALANADVHLGFVTVAQASSLRDKYQFMAVTGSQRRAPYMDVPTLAELGYTQIKGTAYSLNTPVGVPTVALDRLYSAASQALRQPGVIAGYEKLGVDIVNNTPDMAAKRLAAEAKLFSDIAKSTNAKLTD